MAAMLRSIGYGALSAMALIAFLTALAPVNIVAGPDGALAIQGSAALADDDDDDRDDRGDDDDDRDDDDRDDWDDDDDDDDRDDDDDD